MKIENRLAELGFSLPAAMILPEGVDLPFPWVRVHGDCAFVSGHGPLENDGSLARPLGRVGAEVTEDQAYAAAAKTALAVVSSLKAALGDLDRVVAWTRVFGMVATAPGFNRMPSVINGFSDIILRLWGDQAGRHARSAVGQTALPFNIPVEVEAEVVIRPARAAA